MISKLQNSNLSFKGKFELVIPEDQQKGVNKVLNGSCSPGLPGVFVQNKLKELEQDTIKLPDDDVVRVTFSSEKKTDEHLEQRFDNTPVLGAIKEFLSPIVKTKQTEDNLVIKVDYQPGEQSKALGIRKQQDSDHFCSEKLRSLAIYDDCKNDKTGLNGLDVFSFKKNTELFGKLSERINDLFAVARFAYADIMSRLPDSQRQVFKKRESENQKSSSEVTAKIKWPDESSIQQYKNIGNTKDDTRYVIREFGQTLSDLLGALDPDKQNPEITALKAKIDEQVALSSKSFSTDVDLFKRVISSTLQPEEIDSLKKIVLEGDYIGKLPVLDRPQARPVADVLNIFTAAQGPVTEKGPVNRFLFNLLNVGHRQRLGNQKLKEIQLFADKNHVNIDPCIQTKGNPYYPIDCAVEFGDIDYDQHARLKEVIDRHLGKSGDRITDEEYRRLVLEICPDARTIDILD